MSLHFRTQSRWAAFLGCLLLILAPLAHAEDGPLVVTVVAEDETEALGRGLERALVRLAGLRSEPVRALADELLATRDEAGWTAALTRRQQLDDGRYRLEFDRLRLRRTLRDAEVPMVLGERPALLVWAVYEQGGRRELLGDTVDGPGILDALQALAAARQMPLLFPLGDLQDRRAARPSDIIGGTTEPLVVAGQRYGSEGVVLLHVRANATGAEARAIAAYDDREYRSSASAATPAEAARETVARVLDQLAADLARVAAAPEWVRLGFVGVADYAALERLRAGLTRLQAVEAARLYALAADHVVLQVRTGLEPADLTGILGGSGFVRADPPNASAGSEADAWMRQR